MRAVKLPTTICNESLVHRCNHQKNKPKYTRITNLNRALIHSKTECLSQAKQKVADQSDEKPKNKYALHDPIDLRSKFLLNVKAEKLQKAFKQKQKELQEHLEELTILEKLPEDEHRGNRRHAWIVILSNVDWAAKKCAGPDHQCDINSPIQPFFIEPSTGTHFATNDSNYFTIESVWNESNYYVSLGPKKFFTIFIDPHITIKGQ